MISFKDDMSSGRGAEEAKKVTELKHQQSFDAKGPSSQLKSYKQSEQPKQEQKALYVKKVVAQDAGLSKSTTTFMPKGLNDVSSSLT